MADYSGYTIKRPVSLTPLTSVYEAAAADGRPGRFALKVFHPPASTNARRWYAIEGWLLAAERQQQSAKKDGTVLEVLALGRCEEGAFAVLPWQERLLEPLIKTLHPKGDTLRALAECLLNTLEKWEKQAGGPHGNVKPSNVFFDRTGPLVGMTAQLSDTAFMPGASTEALRTADLAGVGTMLAQIVRRRPPGAWPIEEAPEWKALGPGGKGWLDFCNYLLNPSAKEGELTIAEARRRLRKVPKDANPVKTAALTLAAMLVLGAVSVVGFARFGNYIYIPDQIQWLAVKLKNPSVPKEVPPAWTQLCVAWDTWLIDLQSNGPRLLKTEGLWDQDDKLRKELADFVARSSELLPATLVSEAASEKRLGVLANSPPEAVLNELQLTGVKERIAEAGKKLNALSTQLENWARWNQLRALRKLMEERTFTRTASALQTRLPPQRGEAAYGQKLDLARTLRFLRDLSLDSNGTLLLSSRWSEITRLSGEMDTSGDRFQKMMPGFILERLSDQSSISNFAESLGSPLDEMRLRRKQYLDPQVVRERFLAESPLLKEEITRLTEADFDRWEKELVQFTLVPASNDPRLTPGLDASGQRLTRDAVDLETDAPAPEPGGLPTLSQADFQNEFATLTAKLKSLRDRQIVNRDLPVIAVESEKMAGDFSQLEARMKATIDLLKPEIWLAKVENAYGKFNETKQRWAAWQQATLTGLTPAVLAGVANRPRFRELRANERTIKEWIDGVEGPTGFGALPPPDLEKTASPETAAELVRLEAALREQKVAAVAAAAEWRAALPVTTWDKVAANVRAPLEAHRDWLVALATFASNLDRLGEHLLAGKTWTEGVSEVFDQLKGVAGVEELAGRPAESYAEAKQLGRLVDNNDRGELLAAAQSGGLSRKLMAWRQLGSLAGWPAGPEDFDLDGGVVKVMREIIGRDVKDELRKGSLLEELVKQTRDRFNRAARRAAVAEAQLTAMFERMEPAGITTAHLEAPVAYNLALWGLKRSDWNEKNLDRLDKRRDTFVAAVDAIAGIRNNEEVRTLVKEISAIELKDDPNRAETPSPATAGWAEELKNDGLTLTATWTNGTKKVTLDYDIVQPTDGMQPFYLARRAVAVGEFVDLINVRTKPVEAVLATLPVWAQLEAKPSSDKPWDKPLSWRPRSDGRAYEMNPSWIYQPTSPVKGLLDNAELRASTPALAQAVNENPTARTPVQMVPPETAKLFAEQVLGARLPKPTEWRAVTALFGKAADGYFRGPSFRNLWQFLENYREGGQVVSWRPNEGIYLPVAQVTGAAKKKYADDGAVTSGPDKGKLWFAPVDDGPSTSGFINLYGNVWVYLCDNTDPAKPVFYVAGGSVLSPPGVDIVEPQKVEAVGMIGATKVREGYADVGIRPASDAPPGFRERYKLNQLVRHQNYLTL